MMENSDIRALHAIHPRLAGVRKAELELSNMTWFTPMLCVALVLSGLAWCANAEDALPRVGWEEKFDSIDRWKKALEKPGGTPPAKVELVDGAIHIVTACGALEGITKDWPEWKSTTGFTGFEVVYDDVVDFDVYRYLVVRTLEKGTFVYMALHVPTKVMHTTGVRSQDLKAIGVSGKKRVHFYFNMLNSSGAVKIDYIRLVRELLPEEKAGFIGEGMVLREEKLPDHPYHGLEAFNARAGRPNKLDPLGGEQLVYRDFSTQAEIWKMTNHPNNETYVSWNCDGSAFTVQGRGGGGFHVYDFTTGKFTLVTGGLGDAAPRFSSVDPAMIIMAENKWIERPNREISLHNYNFRTGEKTKIAAFKTDAPWIVQELSLSGSSSKMLFGFRETNRVYLI
ncbi:MAG TPA: hypothetical protein VEJ63_18825, partial [Planctomycetota bacterium]|nr:hypothetical protein [Planctomycetota bacterium]